MLFNIQSICFIHKFKKKTILPSLEQKKTKLTEFGFFLLNLFWYEQPLQK